MEKSTEDNGKSGLDLQNWLNRDTTKCPTGLDYEYALSSAKEETKDTDNKVAGSDAANACIQLYYEIPDDTLTHAAIAKAFTKSWYDLKDKFDYTKG